MGRLRLNTTMVKAGEELGRIHLSTYHATEFNPGMGAPTRFALISDLDGNVIPTLYAGTSYMCATFEYLFHNIDAAGAFKSVALTTVDRLSYSRIAARRDLKLVRLFEHDLNKLQLTRADLIDTPASSYSQTRLWAEAVHAQSDADGLMWTSRRCDPERALILFGDRVGGSDLTRMDSQPILTSVSLFEQFQTFAEMAGITLTS